MSRALLESSSAAPTPACSPPGPRVAPRAEKFNPEGLRSTPCCATFEVSAHCAASETGRGEPDVELAAFWKHHPELAAGEVDRDLLEGTNRVHSEIGRAHV